MDWRSTEDEEQEISIRSYKRTLGFPCHVRMTAHNQKKNPRRVTRGLGRNAWERTLTVTLTLWTHAQGSTRKLHARYRRPLRLPVSLMRAGRV